MKRAMAVFAGIAAVGLSGGVASAVAGPLPQGSYLESCRDAKVVGGTLLAICRQPDGEYWGTAALAEIGTCAGDIVNRSGALACERGPMFGSSAKRSPLAPRPSVGLP